MTERQIDIAEQLRRFNQERLRDFGRAPDPHKPLEMPHTGVGGDVAPAGAGRD